MYIFSFSVFCGLCPTYEVTDRDDISRLSNETFTTNKILEELYKLNIQMNNMYRENEGLKKEQMVLKEECKMLQTRVETLQKVVKDLHSENDKLQIKQTYFKKEISVLRKDVALQKSKISGLQSEFNLNRKLLHSMVSGTNVTATSISRLEQYMQARSKTVNNRIGNLEQTLRTSTNSTRDRDVNGNTGTMYFSRVINVLQFCIIIQ